MYLILAPTVLKKKNRLLAFYVKKKKCRLRLLEYIKNATTKLHSGLLFIIVIYEETRGFTRRVTLYRSYMKILYT